VGIGRTRRLDLEISLGRRGCAVRSMAFVKWHSFWKLSLGAYHLAGLGLFGWRMGQEVDMGKTIEVPWKNRRGRDLAKIIPMLVTYLKSLDSTVSFFSFEVRRCPERIGIKHLSTIHFD